MNTRLRRDQRQTDRQTPVWDCLEQGLFSLLALFTSNIILEITYHFDALAMCKWQYYDMVMLHFFSKHQSSVCYFISLSFFLQVIFVFIQIILVYPRW